MNKLILILILLLISQISFGQEPVFSDSDLNLLRVYRDADLAKENIIAYERTKKNAVIDTVKVACLCFYDGETENGSLVFAQKQRVYLEASDIQIARMLEENWLEDVSECFTLIPATNE